MPYTLVVGQLSEGPLVLAGLRQAPPGPVTIGLPIVLGFHTEADGVARYHFLPTGHRSGSREPRAPLGPDVGPTGALANRTDTP